MKEYHCTGMCCGDFHAMPLVETIETEVGPLKMKGTLTEVTLNTLIFDGFQPPGEQASCYLDAVDAASGSTIKKKCLLLCTKKREQAQAIATNVRVLRRPHSTRQLAEALALTPAK